MVKFYQNRELSKKLAIPLSKWKRWSREFLPPDPLGGMQSGYARQYSIDDAFTVYLGGYMVSELKFTIPAAKQILTDLQQWMQAQGFFYYYDHINGKSEGSNGSKGSCCVYIVPAEAEGSGRAPGFFYFIRRVLSTEQISAASGGVRQDRYVQTCLHPAHASFSAALQFENSLLGARVIFLSNLHQTFLEALGMG